MHVICCQSLPLVVRVRLHRAPQDNALHFPSFPSPSSTTFLLSSPWLVPGNDPFPPFYHSLQSCFLSISAPKILRPCVHPSFSSRSNPCFYLFLLIVDSFHIASTCLLISTNEAFCLSPLEHLTLITSRAPHTYHLCLSGRLGTHPSLGGVGARPIVC